jgi:hypothetical protein
MATQRTRLCGFFVLKKCIVRLGHTKAIEENCRDYIPKVIVVTARLATKKAA